MIAKILLYSKIFGYNENFCFMFLGSNDPVLVFSISTLNVMILFRIVWVAGVPLFFKKQVLGIYVPSFQN